MIPDETILQEEFESNTHQRVFLGAFYLFDEAHGGRCPVSLGIATRLAARTTDTSFTKDPAGMNLYR